MGAPARLPHPRCTKGEGHETRPALVRMGPFAGVAACAPLAGLALGEAPLGPPSVPVHEDNPQAHVKLTLGDKLLLSGDLGRNQVSWAPCHPNAANTHPGTFPKFRQ